MLAAATLTPPESIAELTERRNVFAVLVCPWNEEPSGPGQHPGRMLYRGDIGLPRTAEAVQVNVDHDAGATVGAVLHVMTDNAAMWAAVKLGHRGCELVRRGLVGISAETDDDGRLSGIALAVTRPPVFASARVLAPARSSPPPDASFAEGGGLVFRGSNRVPAAEPATRPVIDVSGYDRELMARFGMAAMEVDVHNARARYAERLRDRAVRDAERVEEQLLDACVPAFLWPEDTATYRGWVVLLEQQRAADEQRQAAADRAALAELQASIRDQDEIRDERRPSWLTRLGRASAQALSYR